MKSSSRRKTSPRSRHRSRMARASLHWTQSRLTLSGLIQSREVRQAILHLNKPPSSFQESSSLNFEVFSDFLCLNPHCDSRALERESNTDVTRMHVLEPYSQMWPSRELEINYRQIDGANTISYWSPGACWSASPVVGWDLYLLGQPGWIKQFSNFHIGDHLRFNLIRWAIMILSFNISYRSSGH